MSDITARLATVELQLLLHCLPVQELLRFARCNRRLLSAAAAPFSWKFTSLPVDILDWHGRPCVPPGSNLAARIAARIPISVRWVPFCVGLTAEQVRQALAFIKTVHLRELSLLNAHQLSAAHMTELLSSPVIATQLQSLVLADTANFSELNIMPTIARCLPQLTALQIGVGTPEGWVCFASMPALKTLTVTISKNLPMTETRQLGLCRSLRDLTFKLRGTADTVRCLSGLPPNSLYNLARFTLVGWRGVDLFDATGLLKAMPSVHTLTLHQCEAMDSILRNLARVRTRTLQRLVIQLHSNVAVANFVIQGGRRFVPTAPIISFLLCAMGQLRCDLELSMSAADAEACPSLRDHLEQLRVSWLADASLQSFGDRLRIL